MCKRTKSKLLPETLELEVAKTERARAKRKSRARERRGEIATGQHVRGAAHSYD